jgi:hypothetical protein
LVSQGLLWRHGVGPENRIRHLLLCTFFAPAWVAIIQGQPSILLLLLFCFTFISLKQNREYRAGFLLGLGLLKYQIVLPFALIFLLRRKWKFIGGFTGAAFLWGTLSFLVAGMAGLRAYAKLVLDVMAHPMHPAYGALIEWNMPVLKALVIAFLHPPSPLWTMAITAALALSLVLFLARAWERAEGSGDEAASDLMFAAALTASLVISPYLHLHDLTPMVLSLALVVGSPHWAEKSWVHTILTGIIATLYAVPLYLILLQRQALYLWAPILVAFALFTIKLAQVACLKRPVLDANAREIEMAVDIS